MNRGFWLSVPLAITISVSAGAGFAAPAVAAPAKPLIILFTPGISADLRSPQAKDNVDLARVHNAAQSLREQIQESGAADVVIYSPDMSLFVRAVQEARLKLADNNIPTADEAYALAKAAGATYLGMIAAFPPDGTTPNTCDVEFHLQHIESHKEWKSRHAAGGDGSILSQNNALQSVSRSLVADMLAGPLRDVAVLPSNLAPPVAPIPTVRDVPQPTGTGVSLAGPAPTTATTTVANPTTTPTTTPINTPAAPVSPAPAPATPVRSSGADTDGAAEAEKHRGEEQMRAGDVSGAILSFRKAVNLSPLDPGIRSSLAEAYLAANRTGDALSEAKRALTVLPAEDRKSRLAAMRLLGTILTKNGDTVAARTTYEEIIRAQPSAIWAKIGLADLLQTTGDTDKAESLYREARKFAPEDRDAMLGYARLLATKGEYDAALKELTAASGSSDAAGKYRTAVMLFDDGIDKIATLVEQNRTAWQNKRISQEVFYKATASQSAKVSGLVSLLKAVPPPPGTEKRIEQRHNRRILAASLLLQGVASLLSQVETGDTDAASQATLYFAEYHREMKEITDVAIDKPANE